MSGEPILGEGRGESAPSGPLYAHVRVELVGRDGNAFQVLGAVTRALRAAGAPDADVARFVEEATAGGYDDLLQTCMRWVTVE